MAYSVQQIKFELISYVKEFGGDFSQWVIGTAEDAPQALFERHGVDPVSGVWLWKPALTPAAAALVATWVVERHHASRAEQSEGACVFLFKKEAALSADVERVGQATT